MPGLTIVLLVFVNMPYGQAAFAARQITIESNRLAILDQQIFVLRKPLLNLVDVRKVLDLPDRGGAGLGKWFCLESLQLDLRPGTEMRRSVTLPAETFRESKQSPRADSSTNPAVVEIRQAAKMGNLVCEQTNSARGRSFDIPQPSRQRILTDADV